MLCILANGRVFEEADVRFLKRGSDDWRWRYPGAGVLIQTNVLIEILVHRTDAGFWRRLVSRVASTVVSFAGIDRAIGVG